MNSPDCTTDPNRMKSRNVGASILKTKGQMSVQLGPVGSCSGNLATAVTQWSEAAIPSHLFTMYKLSRRVAGRSAGKTQTQSLN